MEPFKLESRGFLQSVWRGKDAQEASEQRRSEPQVEAMETALHRQQEAVGDSTQVTQLKLGKPTGVQWVHVQPGPSFQAGSPCEDGEELCPIGCTHESTAAHLCFIIFTTFFFSVVLQRILL